MTAVVVLAALLTAFAGYHAVRRIQAWNKARDQFCVVVDAYAYGGSAEVYIYKPRSHPNVLTRSLIGTVRFTDPDFDEKLVELKHLAQERANRMNRV